MPLNAFELLDFLEMGKGNEYAFLKLKTSLNSPERYSQIEQTDALIYSFVILLSFFNEYSVSFMLLLAK